MLDADPPGIAVATGDQAGEVCCCRAELCQRDTLKAED